MRPESMIVVTESGVVKITLHANHEDSMKNLREELFNWYEDFVERESSFGREVSTSHASNPKNHEFSIIPPEADVESACDIMDKLKNLLSVYIVLKSTSALCGEVVQIPIRHEGYEKIITNTITFLDHVVQRYMGGYPF